MARIKRAIVVLLIGAILSSMSPCSLAGGCMGRDRIPLPRSPSSPPKRRRTTDCVTASFIEELCWDEMCTAECASHGHPSGNAYCKPLGNYWWDCCCPGP
ncbi:unnamed protein product [Urochloa decumbens]|uniref:Uncharacterized protein n=1 Tax=Urochloa decumbens TaxID=240449 RepID=A0ABC9BD70_9POAL